MKLTMYHQDGKWVLDGLGKYSESLEVLDWSYVEAEGVAVIADKEVAEYVAAFFDITIEEVD